MSDGPGTPEIDVATATRTLEQASEVRKAANNISVDIKVPPLVIPAEQKTMSEEKKEPIAPVSETPALTSTPEQKMIEAQEMATKFGKVISKGDPMDLKARELRDAWDRATYSGIGKVEESGDLLAKMEKDNQLTRSDKTGGETKPAGSATPPPAAPENPAAASSTSTAEQKPPVPVTPENQVPLNPVKTADDRQAEKVAKMKADVDAKTGLENEVKEQLSQAEKELEAKKAAATAPGGKKLNEGEERAFERDFWIGKLGEHSLIYRIQQEPGFRGEFNRFFAFLSNKERVGIVKKNEQGLMEEVTKDGKPLKFDINWALQHPGPDLVDYLKGEYANKIRGKTEEVASSAESKPVAPPAEDTSAAAAPETTAAQGPAVQPAEKPSAEEADNLVKESTAQITPEEKLEEECLKRGYKVVLGEGPRTLINAEGNPVIDKRTGKQFKFEFFSETDDFFKYLDNENKKINKEPAEASPTSAPTETPISEDKPAIELTQEAKDLLEKIEKEKVFMPYVTENLTRILKENGIPQEDINKKTPQELMEILKGKKPVETAPTGTPKPEIPITA